MLNQVVVDFDRDGRLDASGLPTCPVEAVAQASSEEARAHCKGAIVGEGHLGAIVVYGGSTYTTEAADDDLQRSRPRKATRP